MEGNRQRKELASGNQHGDRTGMNDGSKSSLLAVGEVLLLMLLFFAVTAVAPPAVNEAHYFAKSKNYWDPTWCSRDLFASSGNPHLLFHITFGALTKWCSLEATAWMGRVVGWMLLAIGLRFVTRAFTKQPFASLFVAVVWIAGTLGFNLAGEWVIGGIEGKVPAYAMMLFALRMMIDGKWSSVWPLLGIASGFHVLVGGWSVLISLVLFLIYRHPTTIRSQLAPLFLGGVISLSGVYPALILTDGVEPSVVTDAAKIYSYERLTHHLLPAALHWTWYLRHGFLILLAGVAFWQLKNDSAYTLVRGFSLGAIAIAMVGLIIGVLPSVAPEFAAKLLRFYWFRMTDSVVPLAFALAWIRIPVLGILSPAMVRARWGVLAVSLVIVGNAAWSTSQFTVMTEQGHVVSVIGMNADASEKRRVASDWLAVCQWVDRTMPRDEIFLTPRNQQTFKWYSNRAEVVNWKDVPQDAESLVEWSRRFYDVFPQRLGTVRVTIRYQDLKRFREQYGARFMIVDRRYSGNSLPLVQVYPISPWEKNETYGVYRLP
jgi:hypothetical protein